MINIEVTVLLIAKAHDPMPVWYLCILFVLGFFCQELGTACLRVTNLLHNMRTLVRGGLTTRDELIQTGLCLLDLDIPFVQILPQKQMANRCVRDEPQATCGSSHSLVKR